MKDNKSLEQIQREQKYHQRLEFIERLKDKEYREAFSFEHVATGMPFQIKTVRKQRGWNQVELAERAGKTQSWISAIESDDKASFTLQTLREIASALDVALVVKLVPFSRFLKEYRDVSRRALEVTEFEEDDFSDFLSEGIIEPIGLDENREIERASAEIVDLHNEADAGEADFGELERIEVE